MRRHIPKPDFGFVERFKVLIKETSDATLANAIGVTRETVLMWRHGKNKPDPTNLYKVSKFFDVDPWKLWFGEDVTKVMEQHMKTTIYSEDALAKEVSELKETVKLLFAQIKEQTHDANNPAVRGARRKRK